MYFYGFYLPGFLSLECKVGGGLYQSFILQGGNGPSLVGSGLPQSLSKNEDVLKTPVYLTY